MDPKEEYHDPDYPEMPVCVKEEPPSQSEEEKVEKIRDIIRREFLNELDIRENEVMLIDQRMTTSRRLLHRLRYAIVSSYYKDQKLQLTNGQIQDEIAAQHEPRARAEVSSTLREEQRRLHPSVRKLLGKQTVDLTEILKSRGPRNKIRKDYSAMLQKRNYTISADTTKSLRPDKKPDIRTGDVPDPAEEPSTSRPKKVPRHFDPKITNVVTLDEATRNKMKHRYRIVIGNTSKYVPAASRADRSTHKWLLYIRGPPHRPDLAPVVTAVTVRLHHSYAPHHTVHLDKPPYHISRRGWGEFPVKIELHFSLPDHNRPATVEHTIKLDRNYTGLQMLGAETLVDVWLYSTPEMLPHEFIEEQEIVEEQTVKTEQTIEQTIEQTTDQTTDCPDQTDPTPQTENWLEFFAKGPTQVDVDEMIIKPIKKEKSDEKIDLDNVIERSVIDKSSVAQESIDNEWCVEKDGIEVPNELISQPTSPKKRIVKYIDPTTGKIYYLEMDRNLDLSKVQEIVINNTKTAKVSPVKSNGLKSVRKKKSGGVSLLKPEVKNMLKNTENKSKINYAHIENDHCYLATPKRVDTSVANVEIKKEKSLYDCLCSAVRRLTSVRSSVNYLVKKIPLISDEARDSDFSTYFPFVVDSEDKYWKYDFAKRRNIEWSRAKLINKIITDNFVHKEPIWRTKQILLYSRLHGHYPIRKESLNIKTGTDDWSSWDHMETSRRMESDIKELYPNPSDINTLSVFNEIADKVVQAETSLSDDDIDVVSYGNRIQVKREVVTEDEGLSVMPVEGEDRLRYLFIERKCSDIGIELRNEDIGNGYSYSAVHAVLFSAMKSFAEELVRASLAAKLAHRAGDAMPTVWTSSSPRATLGARDLLRAAHEDERLRTVTRAHLGTPTKLTHKL